MDKRQKPDEQSGDSLFLTAVSDEAIPLLIEYAETGLDALVDNEAIKALPVVGTVIHLVKGALGLRDYLFLQKLLMMLKTATTASAEERIRWKEQLRLNQYQGQKKVGQSLMLILDKLNSVEKAVMLGKVFRAYLSGECDHQQALYLGEIIERAYLRDLENLSIDTRSDNIENLVAIGVMKAPTFEDYDRNMGMSLRMGGMSRMSLEPSFTKEGSLLKRILRTPRPA